MTTFYDAQLVAEAQAQALDPRLVLAVVLVESAGLTSAYRFEPEFWTRYCADNPAYRGANPQRVAASYGLMQIMYPTAQQYGFVDPPEHLFVPEVGLHFGCRHLAALLQWADGDIGRTLAAYNGGKGNASKPQPLAYSKRVRERYGAIVDPSIPLNVHA